MSPAPYPPLHAGDDVDAAFFDELGDELDSPAEEGGPQKHQDPGLASLSDIPGSVGFITAGSRTWSSPPKVHPEEDGCDENQEGDSHVSFDVEDAYSKLSIGGEDVHSVSKSGDAHQMSNGDDLSFYDQPVEVARTSEPRASDPESPEFGTTAFSVHPDADGGAVSNAESGGPEVPAASISTPEETSSDQGHVPEPNLSSQLSPSFNSVVETASVAEEVQTSEVPFRQGVAASPEVPKPQAQTTKVQEVQWSNFGAQGNFGSFSDFLSDLPADSSHEQSVSAPSYSELDFYRDRDQSTPAFGYNEQQSSHVEASVFDLQEPHFQGQTAIAEAPSQLSTTGYLQQDQLPLNVDDQPALGPDQQVQGGGSDQDYWHSQRPWGQEQQGQSEQVYQIGHNSQSQGQVQRTQYGEPDNRQWQEVAEYPGWLFNTLTGEWLEKNKYDVGAVPGSASDYLSGQYHGQSPDRENENSYVQSHETISNSSQSTGQTAVSHLGQSTESALHSDWTGYQGTSEQTNITHNPLSEAAVLQQESTWQEPTVDVGSTQVQTGWEDQYPGWYYDYQAREWKEYSQASQGGVISASELSVQPPQSTSLPTVSYEQPISAGTLLGGYNLAGKGAGPDGQYSSGDQYFRDAYSSQNVVAGSLRNESQVAAHTQSFGQWTGGQHHQFGNPASYSQFGQSDTNGMPQQSQSLYDPRVAANNAQHVDPQVYPDQLPEIPYNLYAPSQMAGHTPQPWSAMNTYETQHYLPYAPQTPPKAVEEAMRTSVGRPPHVLTSFGFGGKLVIMKLKDPLSLQSSDGYQVVASGQALVPGPVHVHSLSQLVAQRADPGTGETGSLYFGALGHSALSGPLVGGSLSTKDLSKWLEDRSVNCQLEEPNYGNKGALSMLWGLLKLACKHYGKLRSAAGSAGILSQEVDGPEAALANLLTSGGDQSSWTMGSFTSTVCLQPMPSEHQLQVTAAETKKLLVAGKRKEALKHAQLGQLWGPALVLARQLGEKYYADTVAEMAQRQFLPGSPLRTLSLLLAGQPAEVFSGNSMPTAPGEEPMQVPSSSGASTEAGVGCMLEEWQENLSIMAANRTSGDDRVISHLGDCLWKVKGEVAAAHICYLVADVNFESFSTSARLCLIGADHWKNPRTYASPEAIQRTEVYEYSKVLGNPQYILVSFQPYKLIYASMLAEAGKTAEALRYCQAVMKTLKTAGRSPEVETCRIAAASLEDRLRFHVQGGHSVNLAPGKIVRGFLNVLDRSIHNIIGGPPPSTAQEQLHAGANVEAFALQDHLAVARFVDSPTRFPAPLAPSASAEKINEPNRYMPPRSVSEPDFSSTMKEKADQGKPLPRTGVLGRFGSVFSKAGGLVSMVSIPRASKNEAKLGDTNKFYYDEKLKRWVEEGGEAPQEEAPPPPPPTSASFLSKGEELAPPDKHHGVGSAGNSGSKSAYLGTPPVPPSNQFSARTRQHGVRSRYVDTFNKGGNSTPSKSAVSAFAPVSRVGGTALQPMNFFVPGSSLDSLNGSGSVSEFENRTTVGSSDGNQVGPNSELAFNMEERLDPNQYSAVQSSFHQTGMVVSSMHRVPSSDNTPALGTRPIHRAFSSELTSVVGPGEAVEASAGFGKNPSSANIGLSNGYHSRANSWSGYPSNFQMPQTDTNSSTDNSATNISMYNGFSSNSTMTPPPSVGSYFPSPPKVDGYKPNDTPGLIESFVSPPPSITPFMTATMADEFIPGALEASSGSRHAAIPLVGDDLQEVEL